MARDGRGPVVGVEVDDDVLGTLTAVPRRFEAAGAEKNPAGVDTCPRAKPGQRPDCRLELAKLEQRFGQAERRSQLEPSGVEPNGCARKRQLCRPRRPSGGLVPPAREAMRLREAECQLRPV